MLSGQGPGGLRNGADYWLRSLLVHSGSSQILLLPMLVVVVLMSWHLIRQYPWTIRLETQFGMLAESLLLAVTLVVLGQLHHLIFVSFQSTGNDSPLLVIDGQLTHAISYIGAGVYEEVIFRLMMVPPVFGLFRMIEFPPRSAAVMSACLTSFMFALAHHVGPAAEAFNLFAFSFRAAAGMFFFNHILSTRLRNHRRMPCCLRRVGGCTPCDRWIVVAVSPALRPPEVSSRDCTSTIALESVSPGRFTHVGSLFGGFPKMSLRQ